MRTAIRIPSHLVLCSGLMILSGAVLSAQLTTGTVQGKVTDRSGAVVQGAELVLTNVETNLVFRQSSADLGNYVFNFVPPGSYTLAARMAGFRSSSVTGILVEVNKNAVVDFTLDVGAVTESVEVSASAEIVDTQSAAVKTNVGAKMITELPTVNRNPLEMAELAPGVIVNSGGFTGGSQMLSSNGMSANVSGGRQQQNTFYLDGADNSGAFRNLGLQMPNTEAVQEVQVVTSSNSAEFGKQPGGYFNVITKSGTNEFHGSAFYFGQNSALNANTWDRNRNGLAKAPANRKQYGGTFGGRIIRDKTFFFTSFQRYTDEATSLNSTIRYPTAQFLQGDLSAYKGQLYNPDTGVPIPNNDLRGTGLIDPVSLKLGPVLFPTVQNLGDRLIWQFVAPPRSQEILAKIDHSFTHKHRIQLNTFQTWGNTKSQTGNDPVTAATISSGRQNTTSARHTWLVNANFILESQFAMATHENNTDSDPSVIGRDLSDFGAKWPQPTPGGNKYFPNIELVSSGQGPSTPQASGGLFNQKTYRAGSGATWVRGRHNFKFGFESEDSIVARNDEHDLTLFRFQGQFSNRNSFQFPSVADAAFAHSFADFMMGRIENFSTAGIIDYHFPAWSHYAFVQDQWRLNQRLTVNLGLRYEIYTPAKESSGRSSAFVAGHQSDQFPNIPLHVAFQGDKGIPEGFVNQDKNNFAPRLSAAYDVRGDGKTAIRAGFGVYYAYPAAQIRTYTTTEFPVVPNVQSSFAKLYDPWGTSESPVYTTPPTPFPPYAEYLRSYQFVPPFARIIGFDKDFTTPYSLQWNVSVEREVKNGMTVTGGYVGNRGKHLLQGVPFNYARFVNTPSGQPPNATNFQDRVPYSTMSRFSIIQETNSRSWYDAMQLSSHTRFRSLTSVVTYVYQHNRGDGGGFGGFAAADEDPTGFTTNTNNPANPRAEIGNRERLHVFRIFSIYQLPVLRHAQTWAGKMLGGWQLSGNFSYFSGDPLDVILGYDANLDAITSSPQDRPDQVGPIKYTQGSKDDKMRQWFDVPSPLKAGSGSAFAAPVITGNNLFGNLPRNAIWGPSRWKFGPGDSQGFPHYREAPRAGAGRGL